MQPLPLRLRFLLLLGWLVVATLPARAGSALPDYTQPVALAPLLQQVMVQGSAEQSADSLARAVLQGQWHRRAAGLAPNFSLSDQWFVFSLDNPGAAPLRLLVDIGLPNIRALEWFAFDATGALREHYRLGSQLPFANRPLPYGRPLLPMALDAGEHYTVVLRLQGHVGLLRSQALIREEGSWMQAAFAEMTGIWFFIGAMCVMLMYHLFVALITREPSYGYYIAWLAAALLTAMTQQGYGFWLLWPDWPQWERYAAMVLNLAMWGLFGLFAREFLQLQFRQPLVNRFVQGLVALLALLGVLFVLMPDASLFWVVRLGMAAMAGLIVLIWLASFRQWVLGHREARNFFIAWTPFMAYGLYVIMERVWLQRLYDPIGLSLLWVLGITVILLSITLADRMRELRDRTQQARVENRTKSEFLAKMSHEVRTPLNGMLGMAALLRDTRLDKTQRHYSDVIYSSGTTLLTVINDILDYSKIEAGKMTLESIPFDLEKLALDTAVIFKVQADEKGLDLIFDMDSQLPRLVLGDPNRCRQIIINLLSNALKFTEKGEVVLRLLRDPQQADRIRLEVRDTGIGIAAENREHLFDFFTQADNSTSRQYGGTGLGLAICKELAGLMGGSVGVESELHEGSTFWASLALPAAVREAATPVATAELQGRRILVVDDCTTFTRLLARYGQGWGADMRVANSAQQAWQQLHAALAEGQAVDLISIDLHMPGVDGLAFAEQLNRDARTQLIPKLLLTSAMELPARSELRQHGLRMAIEKPVAPAMLAEAFAAVIHDRNGSPAQVPARSELPPASPYRRNILVAEDNEVNQLVIRGMLERLGHEVTVVRNGALVVEAYVMCMQQGSHWKPFDLILMDCEMPEVDGYEATERIRGWEAAQSVPVRIPILALTAHVLPEYLERCLESGMDDYLLKPVNVEDLQAKIDVYVTAVRPSG